MKRIFLAALVIASIATLSVPASIAADTQGSGSRTISLGLAVHRGQLVEGIAFVHGRSKPERPAKGGPLYTFLARGAKWRTTESYVVNPGNGDGVAPTLVSAATEAAAATWEAQVTQSIFGAGSLTDVPLAADWTAPDGVNEVYFSQAELDSATVAVTVVWGVFSGSPNAREIVEWDLVFNDALPESWGDAAVQSGVWDVSNIATHELGHAAGLGDLYSSAASQQTMYGYASPAETMKRTLESGDIAGIRALYE